MEAGFAKGHAKFETQMKKILKNPIDTRARSRFVIRRSYVKGTKRSIKMTFVRGVAGYETGKIASNVRDNSKAKYSKSLIVNYDQNRGYVPCHPQITNHPIYA